MTQKLIGHVFMSYSRRDEAVMRRVVEFLRSRGIDVWVDNEKLIPGTPVWEAEIEKAIFGASATVVILSPDSKASEWVRREISYTERYQKRIFPVLVSGDENSSVSIRLTNHQYVDIRNDEAMGLERLSAALLFYLEDLETRKRRALEDAEEQTQAQAKREKEKREATRLRLERERAEQERVEREKVGQKWAEKEKLAGQKVVEEEPANQQIESRVAPVASAPPQVKKASERKLVSKESGQSSLNFRWFPVLLMALGWAVVVSLGVSLLSMLLNMGVSQPNSFQLLRSGVGILIGALIGALGGLLTALSLWLVNIVSQKKSTLVIMLGWAVGWVVAWGVSYTILTSTGSRVGGPIGGALGGAIGGLAIAYSLRDEKLITDWKPFLIVVLGWSFGWAMAETLYLISNGALPIEFIGLLIGTIGGTVLIWQAGNRPDSVDGLRHPIWGPVFGITLGWAFGASLGFNNFLILDKLITGALIGGVGGGITGIFLMIENVHSRWRSILVITLSWMAGWVIGWAFIGIPIGGVLGGAVGGGIGGFGTAFSMWTEKVLQGWKDILIVTLGWSIGWGAAELSLVLIPQLIVDPATVGILVGILIGGIGGFVTLWQITAVRP